MSKKENLLTDPFIGLLMSVVVYAIGGGLLEVLVNPVVEACPNENKEKAMSLLHSFYCWGQVGVVLLSTLFFSTAGIQHWKIMALSGNGNVCPVRIGRGSGLLHRSGICRTCGGKSSE